MKLRNILEERVKKLANLKKPPQETIYCASKQGSINYSVQEFKLTSYRLQWGLLLKCSNKKKNGDEYVLV